MDEPIPVITERGHYFRSKVLIEVNESRILKRHFGSMADAVAYSFKFCMAWDRLHNWQVHNPIKQSTLMIDAGAHEHGADQLRLRAKKLARFS